MNCDWLCEEDARHHLTRRRRHHPHLQIRIRRVIETLARLPGVRYARIKAALAIATVPESGRMVVKCRLAPISVVAATDSGSVSGDRELKEDASRLVPGRPQPPAMGFDNRAADREAQAHSVGLRRIERFKETAQALRGQPEAGIPHRDAHALPLGTRGADVQFALAVLGAKRAPLGLAPRCSAQHESVR